MERIAERGINQTQLAREVGVAQVRSMMGGTLS